jgi:glycosyltransferase involved in cell wall biosynthesis
MRRPIAGYLGALSERVDAELLEEAANRLPMTTFVLAGPILNHAHFAKLRRLENVHFVGFVPYVEAPALIRDMDCCLVPHVIDNDVDGDGDCIKMYEYMAVGKPIVATPVQGSERFGECIRVEPTGEGFAAAIAALTTIPFGGYPSHLLLDSTWEHRFSQLLHLLFKVGREARQTP